MAASSAPSATSSTTNLMLELYTAADGEVHMAIPLVIDGGAQPAAASAIVGAARARVAGVVHRAEPVPLAPSQGPPYALVQFTIDDPALKALRPTNRAPIKRGDIVLVGDSTDLFISLAQRGEHDGWHEGCLAMTVVGSVPEPALTQLVEKRILELPKHKFTHPEFGTVMSLLHNELPCRLRAHNVNNF